MRSESGMELSRKQVSSAPERGPAAREVGSAARLRARVVACLIVSSLAFGSARPALAWGRMAHRAATRLAETRLTPRTRAAIRDLLDEGESMADASTWADENSRAIPGSAGWHFVNVPLNAERYSPRDCHNNCVVSRLEEFRRVLADPRAPRDRKRMALRFVIHLVEDAHQPLHVGDNRDRGGNNVQVQFFRDDSTNLHQVWDSGLLREGYRGERDLVDDLIEHGPLAPGPRLAQGDRRGLGQRGPGGRPSGVPDPRLATVRPQRHAARPRLPGGQPPARRQAARPVGREALRGPQRGPRPRRDQVDPRAPFPQGQDARAPAAPGPRALGEPGGPTANDHLPSADAFPLDDPGPAADGGRDPSDSSGFDPSSAFSGSSTPCSSLRSPKIFSKLGNPYFLTIGPLIGMSLLLRSGTEALAERDGGSARARPGKTSRILDRARRTPCQTALLSRLRSRQSYEGE